MESTNGFVQRWVATSDNPTVTREFTTTVQGQPIQVDPAKALFMFLQRLWFDLQTHQLHPGFDIRSYMSAVLDTVIEVRDEHL
jgi:hypothetical protein